MSAKPFKNLLSFAYISWVEILLGGIVFIALGARAALSVFFSAFGLNQELHSTVQSYRDHLHNFMQLTPVASAINLMWWVLGALALFAAVWALIVVIVDLERDLKISQAFLHPHSFHRSEYWIAALARRLIAVTLYSTIGVYVFLLVRGTPIIYESVLSLFSYSTGILPLTIPTALLALGTWLSGWHLTIIIKRLGGQLDKELAKMS